MAPFKALAGPSPICWAVFVQMEHWAVTVTGIKKMKQKIRMCISNLHFIAALFDAKLATISIPTVAKCTFLLISKGIAICRSCLLRCITKCFQL